MENNNNQNPSFFEKYAAIVKMMMIGILVLLLLIPGAMIQNLISERQLAQTLVDEEIAENWGKSQTVKGPIITIPYEEYLMFEGNESVVTKYVHLLPEDLAIEGKIDTSILKRNIYEMMAYRTKLNFSGSFDKEVLKKLNMPNGKYLWEDAIVSLGISDMAGIEENIEVKWGDTSFMFNPGLIHKSMISSGVSAPIDLSSDGAINYQFDLSIKGTNDLHFLPVGKQTTVKLNSKCPNPSFNGSFLPDERNITDKGFNASWKVLHLNRNFPQHWVGNEQDISDSDFGLSLMLGVDHYQKSMRSAKYAVLFIALTFLTFFFIEVLNKRKIHPVQYILIGLVLMVFYTLLLSLSEQIGFNAAYLVAATAVVLLISIYTASVVNSIRISLLMMTILATLYGLIFTIIQISDYSLLFGSIGLFLFLAVVMILSRKLDWYNIGFNTKPELPETSM